MEGSNSIEKRLHFLKERLEGVVATLSENRLFNEVFLKTVQPILKQVHYLQIVNLASMKDRKFHSEAVEQYKQVNFEEADVRLKDLEKLIHQTESRKCRPNCENKVLEMRKELLEIHAVLEKISIKKAADETISIGRAISAKYFVESFNDAGSTNLENIYGSALADKRAYLDAFESFAALNLKIANEGDLTIVKKHDPEIAGILAPKRVIEDTSIKSVASRHIPEGAVAALGSVDAVASVSSVDAVASVSSVDAVASVSSVGAVAAVGSVDAVTAIGNIDAMAAIGNIDAMAAIGDIDALAALCDIDAVAALCDVDTVASMGHIDAVAAIGLVDATDATPVNADVDNAAPVNADVDNAAPVDFHATNVAQVDAVTTISPVNAVATIGNVDVVVAMLKDFEKLIHLTEKRKCSEYSKNEILEMRKELLEIHGILEKISLKKALEESRSIARAIFTKIFVDPFDDEGLSNLQNIYGDDFADKRAYLDAFEGFAGWDFKNADKDALTIAKKHVPEIIGILAPERAIESTSVKSLACRRIPVDTATAPVEAATTAAPVDAATAPVEAATTAAPVDAVATIAPLDAVVAPVIDNDDAIGAV